MSIIPRITLLYKGQNNFRLTQTKKALPVLDILAKSLRFYESKR